MTLDPATPDAAPTGLQWPACEPLGDTGVVLARPRMSDAPATAAMQSDPALWVDVPADHRVRSTRDQADDFRRFLAHWRRHGFGYWLLWAARDAPGSAAAGGPVPQPLGIGGLRWLWWRDAWVLNAYVRVGVRAQGRGLATTVLSTAMARLDAHLDRRTTLVVRTRPGNTAMVAVATRLGCRDSAHERREMGTYRVLTTMLGGTS